MATITGFTSGLPEAGASVESPPFLGLSVRGIGKQYAGHWVLEGVDLEVRPGEVVAVLGENGAGKSTLSAVVAGLIQPSAGAMSWRGRPHAPATPGAALDSGIGLIHQEMRLLPDLSIGENVFVGRLPMRHGAIDRQEMNRRAEEQLQRLGLNVPASRIVRTLRVAAQQQVEIAKALTLNARLLILDEPTASLGSDETERLFAQVARLRSEGVSFVYISHRLEEIARVADRIVVLRDGKRVATHETAQVPVRALVEEMVGRSIDRIFPKVNPPGAEEVLEVRGLTAADGSYQDVSFSVHRGEIFGIAGIVGAGRTELVRGISGADPIEAGTISIAGRPLRLRGPHDAVRAGLALVPEDRKAQGLILHQTVADNLSCGNVDLLARAGWVWPRRVARFVSDAIKRMGIRGSAGQTLASLSGGNQQKVVIAKWISRDPKVFILDEPTRGIDVGARAAIYDVITGLAHSGMAVVLVSSDLEEVLGLSHRVLVMSRGRPRGVLAREAADQVTVMELATT